MHKLHLFFVAILVMASQASAQIYNFKNFSADDGLPEAGVNTICEDQRGNVWIGTQGRGLLRFDGYAFVSYMKDDGLISNIVHSVYEDHEGKLWIGTDEGVCIYDGVRFVAFDQLGKQPVKAVLQNSSKQYLLATARSGLYRFDGKSLTHIAEKDGLIANNVRGLYVDKKSALWVATGKGVGKYTRHLSETFTYREGLPSDNVRGISEDIRGNVWFATGDGVSRYDGKKFTNFTTGDGLVSNDVYSVLADKRGNVWFGTLRGITKYNGTSFQFYDAGSTQGTNPVTCIYEDSGGNLWFGSGRGLSKLNSERFINYPANDQMGKKVFAIIQALNGNIICGTSLGGVTAFDGKHYSLWNDIFQSSTIQAFYYTPDSVLWVGTQDEGAYRFDKSGFQKFTVDDGIASDNITGFVMDSAGNMWLATANNGVSVVRQRDSTTVVRNINASHGLGSNKISAIATDSQDNIWLATEDSGIFTIKLSPDNPDDVSVTQLSTLNGLSSNTVHSLIIDSNNNIFAGTSNGISIYDGSRIFAVGKTHGLRSNNIYALIVDDDGNLWAGTERGVDKISFGKSFAEVTTRHYGADDGFKGAEVFRNASCKDSDGNIWFGTANGLVKYNRKEDAGPVHIPYIHITGIKLFFDKIETTPYADTVSAWYPIPPQLTLPYHQNNLSFSFTGVYHQNPHAVRYKWKLEGFNNDWSPPVTEREATFSNLPPGRYTFMVMACNEHNVWNDKPAEFTFTILAPFWEKWWVKYGALLLVALVVWMIVQQRIRRIQARNRIIQEKLEMEKNILELEQEAARLQMNPHFIFNSLNSIQGFITTNDAVQAKRYLAKFARLMRLILENAREEFIPLKNEIDILENYLELEKLSTNHKFDFAISVDKSIDPENTEIPPMMLQPFVENAIIHGIKKKEGKGNIQITFAMEGEDLLRCEISDDGIGRKNSAHINGQVRTDHKSTGIAVTTKRLEQYGIHRKLNAGIRIVDLEEAGEPRGTRVVVTIPVEATFG